MPRLTSKDFLAQRRLLIEEWYEHDAIAFGDVPLQGQRDLHDFYAPAEPFGDADALKHRAAMTEAFPSLPQKAGRALQALLRSQELHRQRAAARQAAQGHPRPTARSHGVRIAVVARPKPDAEKLAKAIVKLMRSDDAAKWLAMAKDIEHRHKNKK